MFCTIITHEEGYFQLLPCNKGSLQQIVLHRWSGRFLHQMPGVLFLWLKPNQQSFTWQANVWTTTLQRYLFHSFIHLCLPLSLLLLLLFYWIKPRVATKLQVLRHATHTHTNLNEIWNILICIFFLFLLFPFLCLSSSLSLFSIVFFLVTYWANKDRKKMMSHAPWTTLSQCESDESWRCHLGICFNLLLTSLILSS